MVYFFYGAVDNVDNFLSTKSFLEKFKLSGRIQKLSTAVDNIVHMLIFFVLGGRLFTEVEAPFFVHSFVHTLSPGILTGEQ
jgi:hypothetical protein